MTVPTPIGPLVSCCSCTSGSQRGHYGEAIDDVMECVEFDPPRAIGLLVRGGPMEIHARMSVQADGPHRSLLTIGVDLPSADIPMDPRLLEETTQRIKDLIESDR